MDPPARNDLINRVDLRSRRGEGVYVHPTVTSRKKWRKELLQAAGNVRRCPRWYATKECMLGSGVCLCLGIDKTVNPMVEGIKQ